MLYAGHGNVDEQSSYVTLEDARLSPKLLAQEILDPIAADANHLIVDACYSYLLVGERDRLGSADPPVPLVLRRRSPLRSAWLEAGAAVGAPSPLVRDCAGAAGGVGSKVTHPIPLK